MTQKTKQILSITLIAFLGIFYVSLLFINKTNTPVPADDAQTEIINYEKGMAEDNLFGPLKSLVSGILLLCLCLIYFKDTSPLKFGLIIFIYFLLTRFWVLFNPPYGESIIGHFSDATWLYRNSFNYIEYFKQPSFSLQGSGVLHYPTSIYPSFIAFLMFITPSVTSFLFLIHLCVFAFSSIAIATYREILKSFVSKDSAIILAILLLSLPIFQSMTEVLNMEIPCLLTVILSIYFLINKRIPLASIFAILSVLIKAPGGIVCATVFTAALILFFVEPMNKNRTRNLLWGASTCIIAFIKAVIRSRIMGEAPTHNRISFMIGWPNLNKMPIFWIFVSVAAAFLIISAIKRFKSREEEGCKITGYLRTYYKEIITFAISTLWFLLYVNFSVMGPRYKLLLAPFFIIVIVATVVSVLPNKKILKWALLCFLFLSLIGSHGLYHGEDVKSSTYSYNELERSLEYRNDLKLNIKLAKLLEDKFSNFTIGAPFVTAQLLVMPEVGYVKKPLDVFIYGDASTLDELKDFKGLHTLDIKNTVWVGSPENHITDKVDFPIGENDKIIRTLNEGNKKIHIFMGGFAIEKMRRMIIYIRQQHARQMLIKKMQQENKK